ncbi:MAG: RDD family protein [Deltaproteobacteria bacterium]|nr:RDD family protein [Deltaproteobacteria bacterium]
MRCPKCAFVADEAARSCPKCGTALAEGAGPLEEEQKPSLRRSRPPQRRSVPLTGEISLRSGPEQPRRSVPPNRLSRGLGVDEPTTPESARSSDPPRGPLPNAKMEPEYSSPWSQKQGGALSKANSLDSAPRDPGTNLSAKAGIRVPVPGSRMDGDTLTEQVPIDSLLHTVRAKPVEVASWPAIADLAPMELRTEDELVPIRAHSPDYEVTQRGRNDPKAADGSAATMVEELPRNAIFGDLELPAPTGPTRPVIASSANDFDLAGLDTLVPSANAKGAIPRPPAPDKFDDIDTLLPEQRSAPDVIETETLSERASVPKFSKGSWSDDLALDERAPPPPAPRAEDDGAKEPDSRAREPRTDRSEPPTRRAEDSKQKVRREALAPAAQELDDAEDQVHLQNAPVHLPEVPEIDPDSLPPIDDLLPSRPRARALEVSSSGSDEGDFAAHTRMAPEGELAGKAPEGASPARSILAPLPPREGTSDAMRGMTAFGPMLEDDLGAPLGLPDPSESAERSDHIRSITQPDAAERSMPDPSSLPPMQHAAAHPAFRADEILPDPLEPYERIDSRVIPRDLLGPPMEETRAMPIEPRGISFPGASERSESGGGPEIKARAASTTRRLFAMALDLAVAVALLSAAGYAGLLGPAFEGGFMFDPDAITAAFYDGSLFLVLGGFALASVVLSTSFVAGLGATPGMLICGLRLMDRRTGTKPTVGTAILRATLGLLSLALLGLGWGWVVVDVESRTLHDVWARVCPVRA